MAQDAAMHDSDGAEGSAVHALEQSTTQRRRKQRVQTLSNAKPEIEADAGSVEDEHDDADNEYEVEPAGSASDDCITFVIVVAAIAAMVALFGYMFLQMAAPNDLLGGRLQNAPKNDAKHLTVRVSLEQLYSGHVAHVDVDRQLVCRHCAGLGMDLKAGFHTCHECQGTGVRTFLQQIGPIKQHVRSACNVCKGRGKVANEKCSMCHGHGTLRDRKQLEVTVEKGMSHGDTIVIAREGDQSSRALPGDVLVHLRVDPHALFSRRGDDLELELEISLLEALIGFTREISHLDGRVLRLTRDDLVEPNTVWSIAKQGMPRREAAGQYGDLLVRFRIQYPAQLTPHEKSVVAELLSVP